MDAAPRISRRWSGSTSTRTGIRSSASDETKLPIDGVGERKVEAIVRAEGRRLALKCSGTRSCSRGVPDPPAGEPLPVRVPRREGREGPRPAAASSQGAGDRSWRAGDRPTRDPLDRRRRGGRDRSVWTHFLRGLVARGLAGVGLAVSDAHAGLKARSRRCSGAPGSAAPSISCAIVSGTPGAISTACWRR
jgi:hypothetical protein